VYIHHGKSTEKANKRAAEQERNFIGSLQRDICHSFFVVFVIVFRFPVAVAFQCTSTNKFKHHGKN
jgi:hypothetical protein